MYSQLFFPKMALEKHSSSSVPHFPRLVRWCMKLMDDTISLQNPAMRVVGERDPGILKSQNML